MMAKMRAGEAMGRNHVKALREAQLMSKAELARKAGVSALTIDRVESGKSCRMDTKRKIILALGLKLSDKEKVFVDDETPEAREIRRKG
jgi:DNA-binding XRE family transcriptional regulator